MSTVAEIESAIERLPGKDLRELLSWMDDYRAALGATEALFNMYTAVGEAEIDLAATHAELVAIENAIQTANMKHNEFLQELGLPLLPSAQYKSEHT